MISRDRTQVRSEGGREIHEDKSKQLVRIETSIQPRQRLHSDSAQAQNGACAAHDGKEAFLMHRHMVDRMCR